MLQRLQSNREEMRLVLRLLYFSESLYTPPATQLDQLSATLFIGVPLTATAAHAVMLEAS